MTVVVRTSNDLQNDKVTHFIGKMYGGSINSHGNFNPDDFNYLSMVHVNFREATSEETDWYSKGARALPKYQIGDTVKVIYIPDSDSELLLSIPMSQTEQTHKITNIDYSNYEQFYMYEVDGWEVAEANLELMPKNASTPKPFDKDNFLIPFTTMCSMSEYKELCDKYGISYAKEWRGLNEYHYGVQKGMYISKIHLRLEYNRTPIYTFNELKQLLTNKTEENEVQRTNDEESRGLTGRSFRLHGGRQQVTVGVRPKGYIQKFNRRSTKFSSLKIKGKVRYRSYS